MMAKREDVFAMNKISPQRSFQPKNSLFKAAAVILRSHTSGISPEKIAERLYGKSHNLDALITRATSSPATMTDPTWAGTVAHDVVYSQLIAKITSMSAAAGLMMAGLKVDLTGLASITIPGRLYQPSIAGDWIAEGQAIPVRMPTLVMGPKLEPRKLGVLSAFTSEMIAADSVVEFTTAAITEAAAALLDLKMFSTDPASATAPAGILLGATTVTPTSAAAPWAISSDVGSLVQALAPFGAGIQPVIIAAPSQAASLRMWRQESFYTILASVALPAGTVVAVELSSFVSGLDGLPRFETKNGATLHFEDTSPTDISTGGVVATPVQDLFSTDAVGLKMILKASWAMRNPKHVAIVENVTW